MTQSVPQVSVCMSMYNASLYIRECIDSILSQSFRDFELLIADDGSEDDSTFIVESYKDPRIHLFRNRHDFIKSLNLVLDKAKGKYVAHMDADDVMMPYRLERQISYMEEHPDIDILGGAIQCIGCDDRIITYDENPIAAKHLLSGPVLANPSVMMRASSISKLRYNQDYIYAEDYHFWCQAFKIGL